MNARYELKQTIRALKCVRRRLGFAAMWAKNHNDLELANHYGQGWMFLNRMIEFFEGRLSVTR